MRLLALADHPEDDDDVRLRKQVGVAAGYLTVLAPLTLPLQTGGDPLSWVFAVGLSVFSVGNDLHHVLTQAGAYVKDVEAVSKEKGRAWQRRASALL